MVLGKKRDELSEHPKSLKNELTCHGFHNRPTHFSWWMNLRNRCLNYLKTRIGHKTEFILLGGGSIMPCFAASATRTLQWME